MGFTCGIIGLPNVGKSTIFNALTSAKAAAANFPFCTIEPNTGAVPLADPRLDVLAGLSKSVKTVPTQVMFVDIAGLVRGASKGEGLGNQFLGHIRSVDAVAHVVRLFEDNDIVHVDGSVNPVRDIETIDTELILSDLDTIQRLEQRLEKLSKAGDKEARAQMGVLSELDALLSKGSPARLYPVEEQNEAARSIFATLLTAKPTLFVANVAESEAGSHPVQGGSEPLDLLLRAAEERGSDVVVISGKVESEIAELTREDREEYLKDLGLSASGLDRLAFAGYKLLNLITFFTTGPKETRAWTAEAGTKAPQCAGKIHTDFERGFIRAEVIGYEDFVHLGSEVKVKEAGKLRVEGKEYVMKDGDIVHFRFNV